jgi:hypothetical protein
MGETIYAYVASNPANAFDQNGLQLTQAIAGGAIFGAGCLATPSCKATMERAAKSLVQANSSICDVDKAGRNISPAAQTMPPPGTARLATRIACKMMSTMLVSGPVHADQECHCSKCTLLNKIAGNVLWLEIGSTISVSQVEMAGIEMPRSMPGRV